MISCIAIDDEPLALEIMTSFCSRVDFLELKKTFTDTQEAARYLRKFPVDLIFLDIQMPDKNGIDFYREHGENKMVIFSTAFSEYAVEGFNLNAVDYLLKPVDYSRFQQAAQKARDYFNYTHSSDQNDQKFLFVRSEYSLVKIAFGEIRYIETLDDYLKIHIEGKKTVLTKMNLKNMMVKLDQGEFVRVHRSFIVPLSKIRSVRNKTISLPDIDIPVGLKFEEEFFARYSKS
jgi:DNA-binding LytR/AlgR family response regulator